MTQETQTTPSLEEMNEYAKKVAEINGWKMPDSLEGTIQRLTAELIDITPTTHSENVAEKLIERDK